jgi:hypothetical protein
LALSVSAGPMLEERIKNFVFSAKCAKSLLKISKRAVKKAKV